MYIENLGHFNLYVCLLSCFPACRITEASSTAHLDKVERGYENMDHYNVNFKREGKALRSIDFIAGEADVG